MPCQAPLNVRSLTCPGPGGAANVCIHCQRIGNIRDRRLSISNMIATDPLVSGAQLQVGWTDRADIIVTNLLNNAIQGMGAPPPCTYAFCLAGSGARHEACPYSDLDCFFLVESVDPANTAYFRTVSTTVKQSLENMDEIAGLRFCFGGLNPLGQPGAHEQRPELILTPVAMAALLEDPQVDSHVRGSIDECRLLVGGGGNSAQLYQDYKAETNMIMGSTPMTFSSRPLLTNRRNEGLNAIREALKPDHAPPSSQATVYDIKKKFYRLPQMVVKGLALYYNIAEINSISAVQGLRVAGKLSSPMAQRIAGVLDIAGKIRNKAHLHAGYEVDEVFSVAQGAQPNLVLNAQDLKDLRLCIIELHQIRNRAQDFLDAKTKIVIIGKRGNPFAEN
jgi:hypothetical protein